MSRAHRPIRRVAAFAAACVGAAFLLTACIDINADVAVGSDATGTGTFEMVLQKQAASVLGVTSADQLASQIAGEEGGAIPGMTDCTAGESDAGYTYTCSFTDLAFTDSTDGPWTITKSGDDLVFTMKGNAASEAAAADPSASGDLETLLGGASLGTMTVKVSFPGPISSTTGDGVEKTADNAATVTSDLSKAVDVTITASATAGSSGMSASMIIVLLVALAVIVLIIVVAVVMISRRRNRPTGPPHSPPGIPDAPGRVAEATATQVLTGPLDTSAAVEPEVPAQPIAPEPPEAPAVPTEPVSPVLPTEPVGPAVPTEPTVPAEPVPDAPDEQPPAPPAPPARPAPPTPPQA